MQVDNLIKMTFLMFRTLLSKRTRCRRFVRSQNVLRERLLRQHEIRRVQSKLALERMLYMKMLTSWVQAHSSRRRARVHPAHWFEKTVKVKFSSVQWLKYFRMRKETFLHLVEKIESHLEPGDTNLPVDKQVAVTLLFFSSGKSHNSIAYQFGIQLQKVVSVVNRVCDVIVKVLLPQYIVAPKAEALKEYLNDFENKWGFPQCAGVLGSFHVPVSSVELPENASDYINSDGGHSMFLQAIVDPSYKFWDINIGWPGSVSESRVLTSSALWVKGQEGLLFPEWSRFMGITDVPIFILAGSSYPLAEWVLKPYQCAKPEPPDERKFNEKFAFTYNACEIAFKRLKARWNCLVKGNLCSIDIFPKVASACCTLHNICEIHREPILDEWIVKAENIFKQPLPSACNSVIGPQAEFVREAVKNYFFYA